MTEIRESADCGGSPKNLLLQVTVTRFAAVVLLAVLHIACSQALEFAAEDPYTHCVDLGDLALLSYNRADAETRMKAQVLELGGDTLLFGERGRSGRTTVVPSEIVERRTELVTGVESIPSRPPSDGVTPDQVKTPAGELRYYGAALRCNE
jgi:hypothetical protein